MTRNRALLPAALCLCCIISLIISISAQAAVIYVKKDSSTNGPGTGWDNAYQTVTAAVATASDGDEIHIACTTNSDGSFGNYHEHITLNAGISLLGGYSGSGTTRDPRLYQTILDGGLDTTGGAVIFISSLATGTVLIDGLTIQRGKYYNVSKNGAGINSQTTSAAVTISNDIIQNCQVVGQNANGDRYGGGIYLLTTNVTVTGNIIRGNSVTGKLGYWGYGGGIAYAGSGSPLITNNIIDHNTSSSTGAGIHCSGGTPKIINNTICDNTAGSSGSGGGVASANASPVVANNIIAYNSSGVYLAGSGTWTLNSNCLFTNPTLSGSRDYEGGLTIGIGDILDDPSINDHVNKDYHISYSSKCVDAATYTTGAPNIDLDGLIRPQDGKGDHTAVLRDIGAYEVPVNIATAKSYYANGTAINVGGFSVIGGFSSPNRLYLERADRTGGIRVDTSQTFPLGTVLNVVGTMQTDATTGEKYVSPSATWPQALSLSTTISPLTWTTLSLDAKAEMLINISGTVTQMGSGYLYVDDGNYITDGSKTGAVFNAGVRVVCDPTAYSTGDMLQVTGVATCFKPVSSTQSIILTRGATEIVKTGHVYSSIAAAKTSATLGLTAKLTGLVVTATRSEAGGSAIYAEDPSRCAGIRITTSNDVMHGWVITATGTLERNANGELQLSNVTIQQTDTQAVPAPVGLSGRALGGGAFGNQGGVTDSFGTSTIGLLVTIWGKVTYYDSGSGICYVDDGSNANDGSGHPGVKVCNCYPESDPTGTMLRITGISSCEMSGSNIIRTLWVRDSYNDVTTFSP